MSLRDSIQSTTLRRLALTGPALLLAACATLAPPAGDAVDARLAAEASAGPLAYTQAEALLGNDHAFAAKLALVESATERLDLAYYIFSDDYSSSRLSQALIDAARRGVQVRLLVDYFSAYKDLDRFSWLEQEGQGRIEVRFYNRPTREIVRDAAYLTTSCADVGASGAACDDAKRAAIEARFAAGQLTPDASDDARLAGAGVFLSGLYGKHPKLMAYAITRGQAIDTEALSASAGDAGGDRLDQLKALGKVYFRARYLGGVDGLRARLKLAFARLAFAEQVNPVFETVGNYLPVERQNDAQAQKDWDYLTEFLHHKLLLADRERLVLGGRNVEDSYHMRPNPLAQKYIFMDTDLRLDLGAPAPVLAASFDRLWALESVASLEAVRAQAPNDLLENFEALNAAQVACDEGRDTACVDRELAASFVPLEARIARIAAAHQAQVARYQDDYTPEVPGQRITLDPGAEIHYLENLPVAGGQRSYGARHGEEAAGGKHIQSLWRSALKATCEAGDGGRRRVVVHNAYLFLPANLLQDLGAMIDGSRPCGGVDITLLTNSLETTDLNVVNLLAVWQLKALADHLKETPATAPRATFRYLEYQPVAGTRLSLHSKVMVFDQAIFIGSSNADVRSLMMDSNNGLFIRRAPDFIRSYTDWLDGVIAQPGRTTELTASLGRDANDLATERDRLVDRLLDRYAGEERMTPEQRSDLKLRLQAATGEVYVLSRKILRGDAEAADRFNALFKAI
ncbi:MAG: hypothetical protein KDH20_07770 [Rhodocyclaceae bacterium]|nr:hypothetical protein [Rhodocyclaceae bacterium]